DPVAGKIVINTLGSLNNPNDRTPRGEGPVPVLDARTLREARASGLTAVNVTVGYVSGPADPFEATVKDIAATDAMIRAYPKDFLKAYGADDILRAKAEGKIAFILG